MLKKRLRFASPTGKSLSARTVALYLGLMLLVGAAFSLDQKGYHLLKTFKFGAAPGSTREYFDYITVDSPARRVYVSHGTEIKILNADTGSVLGNIAGLKQGHGVALASEFNRGFISDGAAAKVVIFDLKTLKPIGEAKADNDADSIVYDPASKRVFVMNGDPNSATVINAQDGSAAGTIPLGGAPEFAVADGKGKVFVNLEDKNEVVTIDSQSLTVKSRWPVAPAGGPTALAFDQEHQRLFSAGREPQMLVMMDANDGHVIQSAPISSGADAAVYEPETGLIFVSTREGLIHVFHEDSPAKFTALATINTAFGAKTMGLDTKTHKLFVDTANFGGPGKPTKERPHPQRVAIPGTFRVMVYGQ
jgi:DNA-binding beta-propeller fold protein YncE